MKKTLIAAVIAMACGNAYAIDPITPLDSSQVPATLATTDQDTMPFVLAPGWTASKITDRNTLFSNFGPAAGGEFQASFGNWDMVDTDRTGRYAFIPFEVTGGAGVVRYDRITKTATTLLGGNSTGLYDTNANDGWDKLNDDFQRFDPATYTPAGTLLTGEEEPTGRLFEIRNPSTANDRADADVRWLSNVPSVHHEGLRFDGLGRLYFVDENNSGSIYRMTPNTAGDYSSGKVEVLVDNDGLQAAGENYNSTANQTAGARTGAASWIEIVDASGNPLTSADPFDYGNAGGRSAGDEVNATPYGRPEDMVIGSLFDDEILYFTATSEAAVYGINLKTDEVFEAVKADVTMDSTTGVPVPRASNSTYGLNSPDNLELTYGPDGEIQLFVVEDQNPGDIWLAVDSDRDGVMDEMGVFLSLGPFG
ncbi:MAG: phosphatase, partial [Gammaproteobacteria bacterium]|nr:phosphatase [Gammaproteobacteria bacterium]